MIRYDDLIGTPFRFGGRGPETYDCYGLVMEMLRRDGISPNDYGWHNEEAAIEAMMLSAAQTPAWEPCQLQPKCVMLFRTGRFVRHVAYALNTVQFIHCWQRSGGVVVEQFSEDWSRRLVGCYRYAKDR